MPEKTILLVDDDASLRRVLAHHLTEAGYRVLAAADGKSGLEMFTEEQVEMPVVMRKDALNPTAPSKRRHH